MWTFRNEDQSGGRILRTVVELDGSPASFAEVLRRWKGDADFRSKFIAQLADSPFSAFRWETPALTAETADRPFEFVLLHSPRLAANPDPNAFAEHFNSTPGRDVIEFPNLGKDAVMIVPCPKSSPSVYGHLAAFVRGAPEPQKHALWELVGDAMIRRLGSAPIWLNTAGAGVSWLHVRLDNRPKYYGYEPYRQVKS